MPVKARDWERLAADLGFERKRQKGDHVRWKHPDGRATTIPVYAEIGGWLLYEILAQLGATKEDLNRHNKKVCSKSSQLVK
ncbi:MAG TPA: type II toxin-antitoxin system HicA family toxin [Nostocaceae cyanobacterium]|nr:type II toxin-antitoxin system HicA family toxin [Nostocaceae cyanobacterium]